MAAGDRNVALIGPGRAGTTLGLALSISGWRVVAVAGRAPDAASTVAAAAALGSPPSLVSEVGGAQLVIIATPDRAIEHAPQRRAVARARRARRPPRGSRGLDVFDDLRSSARTCASARCIRCSRSRRRRSASSGSRVVGRGRRRSRGRRARGRSRPPPVSARRRGPRALSRRRGRRLEPPRRAARSGRAARGVVRRAVRGVRAARAGLGRERVRSGPRPRSPARSQRGDLATVEEHLAALDPAERDAYRALAREAARLTGRRDTALDRLLGDVRQGGRPPPEA